MCSNLLNSNHNSNLNLTCLAIKVACVLRRRLTELSFMSTVTS